MNISLKKKILKRIGDFFYKIARYFWNKTTVCNHCGRDVGFNSCVSRFGFNCWDCHDKLVRIEKYGR
jgi:tRNA(Ile2) C34 agmatinyltransferase TiaS